MKLKLRKVNEPMYKTLGKKVFFGGLDFKEIKSIRMRNRVRKYVREQLDGIRECHIGWAFRSY